MEQTLVIIKPDGVKRGLVGQIIQRIEDRGFSFSNIKLTSLTEKLVKEHYAHLTGKSFFGEILSYMTSGPVICMVVTGEQVIPAIRQMIGATNPLEATPGTVRGDYAVYSGENIIHASDSNESAQIEIQRFFG